MAREIELLGYWMPILRQLKEFKEIAKAETPELKYIVSQLECVLNNMFIETSDEYGVGRLEKIAGISPNKTDTLEERKFNLIAKYNENLPYTVKKLHELLAVLCGEKGYHLEINHNEFKLTVKIELTSKKSKTSVEELLERVVPVNMILSVTLMYNQHKTVGKLTNEELRKYTHNGVREEALING